MNNSDKTSDLSEGFMLLHGSSVDINGKALVFLGHSSSGKSTIAKLLSKTFPLISDDKVLLFREKQSWLLKSGDEENKLSEFKEDINMSSGIFQINSFVRIFQSENNRISKIEPHLLSKYLIDGVFEVDNQRNCKDLCMRIEWFRLSVDLAKNIQGWQFYFKKNSDLTNIIKVKFEK